mmetsp:Transcript_8068/g.23973  ORF Transcript_8068/g.23973 Transcript_8068/m.23973 type:complete len:517 (-) Transcript_8068:607-2157(-)
MKLRLSMTGDVWSTSLMICHLMIGRRSSSRSRSSSSSRSRGQHRSRGRSRGRCDQAGGPGRLSDARPVYGRHPSDRPLPAPHARGGRRPGKQGDSFDDDRGANGNAEGRNPGLGRGPRGSPGPHIGHEDSSSGGHRDSHAHQTDPQGGGDGGRGGRVSRSLQRSGGEAHSSRKPRFQAPRYSDGRGDVSGSAGGRGRGRGRSEDKQGFWPEPNDNSRSETRQELKQNDRPPSGPRAVDRAHPGHRRLLDTSDRRAAAQHPRSDTYDDSRSASRRTEGSRNDRSSDWRSDRRCDDGGSGERRGGPGRNCRRREASPNVPRRQRSRSPEPRRPASPDRHVVLPPRQQQPQLGSGFSGAPVAVAADPAAAVRAMMGIGAGQMPGGSCLDANQKKRLLWGAKKAEAAVGGAAGMAAVGPEAAVGGAPGGGGAAGQVGANRWDTAQFDDLAERDKFQRLMGVKSVSGAAAPPGVAAPAGGQPVFDRVVTGREEQERQKRELERSFLEGVRRGGNTTIGLGL